MWLPQSDLQVYEVNKIATRFTPPLPVVCFRRELRLRNYVPEDEDLKRRRVPQAKPVAGRWAELLCSALAGVTLSENTQQGQGRKLDLQDPLAPRHGHA